MRGAMIVLAWVLSASCALAQLTVEATSGFRIEGLENAKQVGGLMITTEQPTVKVSPAAIVTVLSQAANVSVLGYKIPGMDPVEISKIGDGSYCLTSPGKTWVDVTAWDFQSNIYDRRQIMVELGSAPLPPQPPGPGPNPPTPPAPSDCSAKTNSNFDNLAARACQWASEVPDSGKAARSELSSIYLDTSDKLASGQHLTIQAASTSLLAKRAEVLKTDELISAWAGWLTKANEELAKRWQDETTNTAKRAMMVEFYRSLGEGLK